MKTIGAAAEDGLGEVSDGYNSIVKVLARISRSPGTLFLALLLVSAAARPYADLLHDSRLYAVIVLDRADPGLYSDDVFLRYGSQDKFSVFSRLVTPATTLIGLRPTFFVLYLFSSALMLYSAQRFVMSFIRQRVTAALALFYVAVNPIVFGGLKVFHVNETFLTPRLWAIALVFFALEQLVYERTWRSLLLIILALIIHPIMAFSALLVWVYVVLTATLSNRQVITVGVVVGSLLAVTLCYYPIGSAIFGPMDATWRQNVLTANEYINPSEWQAADWLRIATAFVITFMARQHLCFSAPIRRCLDATMFAAVVGIVGAAVATRLPYALPLQGQQYRAVWLLQFMQIPLVVSLLRHMWRSRTLYSRAWAFSIGGVFAVGTMSLNILQILSFGGLTLLCRIGHTVRRSKSGGSPGWLASTLWGLGLAVCIAPLLLPIVLPLNFTSGMPSLAEVMRCVPMAIGALMTWLTALLAVVLLYRWTGGARKFGLVALASFVVFHTIFFVAASGSRGAQAAYKGNIAPLREFLDRQYGELNRLPTVYWPRSGLDHVWVGLQAKCYFTKQQAAGNMFNRGNAIECQRRAHVVRPFELSEIARQGAPMHQRHIRALVNMLGDGPGEPTLRDLYRLCCEEIDVVVAREQFEGFYSTKIGPFFVYECEKIREGVREGLAAQGDAAPKTLAVR